MAAEFELALRPNQARLKFDRQLPVFNWYYPFDLNVPPRANWREGYSAFSSRRRLALYFHVPFCETICNFCPFIRGLPGGSADIERYVDALVAEVRAKRRVVGRPKVDAIAIGGGTPSVLSPSQILRLGDAVHDNFDLSELKEFTCELEAKSVTFEKLRALTSIGVNRFSIGVQTTSQRHRDLFDLTVSVDDVRRAVEMLNENAPYTNVDMIYAIPGQTQEELMNEVADVISFGTTTIDFYPLNNLASQKRMHRRAQADQRPLIDASQRAAFRWAIDGRMREAGYGSISGYGYSKSDGRLGVMPRFLYHDILYGYEFDVVLGYGAGAVSYLPSYNVYNEADNAAFVDLSLSDRLHQIAIPNGSAPERGIVTFPYRGDLIKADLSWKSVPEETKERFFAAQAAGLIVEGVDSFFLSKEGWMNYVNLMFFLMPRRGRTALTERIEAQLSRGKVMEKVELTDWS